jgi:hypothetical protein
VAELDRGVLGALIGMMDHAARWPAGERRRVDGTNDELGSHVIGE